MSFTPGPGTTYLLTSTQPVPTGTANGVLYLNGSKVVTSGSALTFDGTNFTTTGYAAGNGIRSLGGNAVRFYNSVNSNWSQISAPVGTGDMQFDTGAGEQMRLTSTGLGIGTSSPSVKLEVAAGAGFPTAKFTRVGTTAQTGAASIGMSQIGFAGSTNADTILRSDYGFGLQVNSASSPLTAMAVDLSGNLLVGTTSAPASQRLRVAGGDVGFEGQYFYLVNAGANIQMGAAQNSQIINNDSTNTLSIARTGASSIITLSTAGSERARITSSGNVGIGTTNPSGKVQIGDTAGASGADFSALVLAGGAASPDSLMALTIEISDTGATGISGKNVLFSGSSSNSDFAFAPSQTLITTPSLILTSEGNVYIGGTADRATTKGKSALQIFNGTAPVGTLANGISIYSDAGEAYVMDAAGNATLFSPHDSETNEWIFRSKHTPTGKVLKIDVERLLRFVNDHFGLDAVREFVEA